MAKNINLELEMALYVKQDKYLRDIEMLPNVSGMVPYISFFKKVI